MDELSLELARLILDSLESVALTDQAGAYLYRNKTWYDRRQQFGERVDVTYPWELFKETGVSEVIRTHKRVSGHIMQASGIMMYTNYFPVMKDGAFFGVLIWAFFSESGSVGEFTARLDYLTRELKKAKDVNRTLTKASYSIGNIFGESIQIRRLKQEIANVARTSSNVLVEGETGVGKELVANAIHDLSNRRDSRFVRVNCSAIPGELMESEFFGYAPGAFTGASKKGKVGKFQLASSGSIFLDEVNLLPLTIQPKLLRVLQEREIEPVGGAEPLAVDVRIIAATNTSLEKLVTGGLFREDLYYRLNVVRVRVPPLRERKDDIPLLSRSLLSKLNHQMGMGISYIQDDVISLFQQYDWPGNIRELQNVIEFAMNYAPEDTIKLCHVENYFLHHGIENVFESAALQPTENLQSAQLDTEKQALMQALARTNGDKALAASLLGIGKSTLYRKMKQHGLQ